MAVAVLFAVPEDAQTRPPSFPSLRMKKQPQPFRMKKQTRPPSFAVPEDEETPAVLKAANSLPADSVPAVSEDAPDVPAVLISILQ